MKSPQLTDEGGDYQLLFADLGLDIQDPSLAKYFGRESDGQGGADTQDTLVPVLDRADGGRDLTRVLADDGSVIDARAAFERVLKTSKKTGQSVSDLLDEADLTLLGINLVGDDASAFEDKQQVELIDTDLFDFLHSGVAVFESVGGRYEVTVHGVMQVVAKKSLIHYLNDPEKRSFLPSEVIAELRSLEASGL